MNTMRSRLVPGLLVSVRSVAEAQEAVAGGAAIIDVKEPSRGPLGRADAGVTAAIAEAVAAPLGLDAVYADCSPAEKVTAVEHERAHGATIMVGDGVNDAPALAAADIGVAMGARGAAASAEAADAVVLVDRIDRLAEAMHIARRARGIALQSVAAGIGLSVAGMLFAAAGGLTPVQGAVLQEVIDVAVILNALRALRA